MTRLLLRVREDTQGMGGRFVLTWAVDEGAGDLRREEEVVSYTDPLIGMEMRETYRRMRRGEMG
jgi:hypothetical protein